MGPQHDQNLTYLTLESFVGAEIAISPWTEVTQAEATAFGMLTNDPDPMHVDVAWAAAHSPYGRTVVAGMHMMALLPLLVRGHGLNIEGVRLAMNYGFNRVRFVAPMPIGAPFCNRATLIEVHRRDDGNTSIVTRNQIELRDNPRPVLVADWVNLLWPI